MSRDRSSGDRGAPWHRVRLWWPVECVPVVMRIVHPRRLTALEWAVLRVVEAFRDAPPPLRDVARELGIEEPGFLDDALRATVRLRALAPRASDAADAADAASAADVADAADAPAQPPDLPDLDFTDTGYALFPRGRIEGEPAEHGATVYFDALTDEAMAAQATDLIALLARAGDDWQDIAMVCQGWARQVAANVPEPTEPGGVTWWLGELAPLRPLLGDELASRAIECARRFAGPLREARARADARWEEVARSYAALDVSEAALEAAIEAGEPARARRRRSGAKPKAKHKNRSKRR